MGQFFYLINIDKDKHVSLGTLGGIFGIPEITTYWCDPDEQNSWAGDRLILLGDYVSDIPAGLEDEINHEDLFAMLTSEGDESEDGDRPPCREECRYDKTSILRNLCTREYIRADLFPDLDYSHPGFGEVIVQKILWCSGDKNRCSIWSVVDPRGAWAGAKFDIVHVDVVKGNSDWKDISETEFFNYYKTVTSDAMVDVNPLEPGCTCGLCQKYRDEHEDFLNNDNNQNQLLKQERTHGMTVEQATYQPASASGAFYPSGANSLSTIEILPAELREEIMSYLSTGDWAACAKASKVLSFQATPQLYTSVTLKRAEQTKTLLETISRCPELAKRIRYLRVVTLASWESLQIAHEILKQLPALKFLEFARCWLSYGNLPLWDYPFTLKALTWGLKQDSAFDQFRQSQPGAQITLLDPVIGGFWF